MSTEHETNCPCCDEPTTLTFDDYRQRVLAEVTVSAKAWSDPKNKLLLIGAKSFAACLLVRTGLSSDQAIATVEAEVVRAQAEQQTQPS
jgi:hypothetical protein